MMKTRSKLLRESYPVLLLISLLMTWELTSQGSTSNPSADSVSPIPWSLDFSKLKPACRLDQPMLKETQHSCDGSQGRMTKTPLPERNSLFPWERPSDIASPKASAEWESL
jgi:hypothetical protein